MKKWWMALLFAVICIASLAMVFTLTADMQPIIQGIPYDTTGNQMDVFSCMYWMWMLLPMFLGVGFCLDSAVRNQKIVLGRYGTYRRYWYRLFAKVLGVFTVYAVILLAAVAIAYEPDGRLWQAAGLFLSYALMMLCIYTGFCLFTGHSETTFVVTVMAHLFLMLADGQTKCRYPALFAPCYGMINRSTLMNTKGMPLWWIFGVEVAVIAVCVLVMPKIIRKKG